MNYARQSSATSTQRVPSALPRRVQTAPLQKEELFTQQTVKQSGFLSMRQYLDSELRKLRGRCVIYKQGAQLIARQSNFGIISEISEFCTNIPNAFDL